MSSRKPFGRTAAKRQQDAAKLRNLGGAPIPGGGLTDFRAPEVARPLAGPRKGAPKKKGA